MSHSKRVFIIPSLRAIAMKIWQ